MKYLFVRVSCQKERSRWGNMMKQNPNQVIICGDESIEDHYKLDGDVLYLKCRDGYDGLPEKIVCAFKALSSIEKFSDVDRFIKLDRDIVITDEFYQKKHLLMNGDYIGQRVNNIGLNPPEYRGQYHFGNVTEESYWYNKTYKGSWGIWCDGGWSYCLSRKSVKCISNAYTFEETDKIYKTHIYEDLMVSLILNQHNIKPSKMDYGMKDYVRQ